MAVLLLNNALVPHSVDHTMSLLIHLQPLLTAYTLRHHNVEPQHFPLPPLTGAHRGKTQLKDIAHYDALTRSISIDPEFREGFIEYMTPITFFLLIWIGWHALVMLWKINVFDR